MADRAGLPQGRRLVEPLESVSRGLFWALGGLIAGVLLALIVDLKPADSPRTRFFGYLASAGIVAGAVTALAAMFL